VSEDEKNLAIATPRRIALQSIRIKNIEGRVAVQDC
jgi:hypothetical protein